MTCLYWINISWLKGRESRFCEYLSQQLFLSEQTLR